MFSNLTFIKNDDSTLKINSAFANLFNFNDNFLDISKLVNTEVAESEYEDIITFYRFLNDTESYKSPITVEEVKECIDSVNTSTLYLWKKHPWLYSDIRCMKLEDFWERSKIRYDVVLSSIHLLLLINYYVYISWDIYFEKKYGGDDKYIDSLKMRWNDDVKDRMHVCDICENLVESSNNKKIKIRVRYCS